MTINYTLANSRLSFLTFCILPPLLYYFFATSGSLKYPDLDFLTVVLALSFLFFIVPSSKFVFLSMGALMAVPLVLIGELKVLLLPLQILALFGIGGRVLGAGLSFLRSLLVGSACVIFFAVLNTFVEFIDTVIFQLVVTALGVGLLLRQRLSLLSAIQTKVVLSKNLTERFLESLHLGIFVALAFMAYMPEGGHDALSTHLYVPNFVLKHDLWHYDITQMIYSTLPLTIDFFYSFFASTGEIGLRIVNVFFTIASACYLYQFALRISGDKVLSLLASLSFLSSPLTIFVSSSLFIEPIFSFFCIAFVVEFYYFFVIQKSISYPRRFLLTVLPAGVVIASKLNGLIILAVISIFNSRKVFPQLITIPRAKLLLAGLIILMGCYPYINSYLISGNPVYPFYNGFFESPFFPAENMTLGVFRETPTPWFFLDIFFNSYKYIEAAAIGAPGIFWVVLFAPLSIGLLCCDTGVARSIWTAGIVVILLTFLQAAYLRYALVGFALVYVGCFAGAINSKDATHGIYKYVVWVGLASCVSNLALSGSAGPYANFVPKVIYNESYRSDYIRFNMPLKVAVDVVNSVNTQREKVAFFSAPALGDLDADPVLVNWYNNFNHDSLQKSGYTNKGLRSWLRDNWVRFVILDHSWFDNTSWRNSALKSSLVEATDLIASFGTVEVRRFDGVLGRSSADVVLDINSHVDWMGAENFSVYDEKLTIKAQQVAYHVGQLGNKNLIQIVFSNSCRASERDSALVQLNWLDANGRILNTQVERIDCARMTGPQGLIVHSVRTPKDSVGVFLFLSSLDSFSFETLSLHIE